MQFYYINVENLSFWFCRNGKMQWDGPSVPCEHVLLSLIDNEVVCPRTRQNKGKWCNQTKDREGGVKSKEGGVKADAS